MSTTTTFKIHPAVGIARVGNSQDYYLAPVTAGGLPLEKDGETPVTQFRDDGGGIRRQAARFQIYVYDSVSPNGRPVGPGQANIRDIQWTVHLANKKASWYEFRQLAGSDGNHTEGTDEQGNPIPQALRNPRTTGQDRNKYIIDSGPRVVSCRGINSTPQQGDFAKGQAPHGYPESFPPAGLLPEGNDITSLGQISADGSGHLDVRGGLGHSGCSVAYELTDKVLSSLVKDGKTPQSVADQLKPLLNEGYKTLEDFNAAIRGVLSPNDLKEYSPAIDQYAAQPRIDTYANNNFWWDDTSDGPVTALVYLEGSDTPVEVTPAWVLVAPPAYAPQILNMITLYDTMYDLFVREKQYNTDLYDPSKYSGGWNPDYKPNRQAEIQPIISRPSAYQWVANIDRQGVQQHGGLDQSSGRPSAFLDYMRPPGAENSGRSTLMPMLAGDNPISTYLPSKCLTLTRTQFFLLSQFSHNQYDTQTLVDSSGPGEQLDRAVLENCVGGAFCPGIEMTWVCRSIHIYSEPFRILPMPVSGKGLQWDNEPTAGKGLEPGDATKYMALPWQADFNECSDQTIDDTVLWWWPAQRPYYVNYKDEHGEVRRGSWTRPTPANFNEDVLMVYNWKDLGFIIQQDGTSSFLEVQRLPLSKADVVS